MTDIEYITLAVKLIGWKITNEDQFEVGDSGEIVDFFDTPWQLTKDALAAQLVRQCTGIAYVTQYGCARFGHENHVTVQVFPEKLAEFSNKKWMENVFGASGTDQSMNTIKAIVDSGVLITGDS